MDNRSEMLQLCRLCLVKDDVNIPIFEEQGDIRKIFLKISSCLPVKVSREDKLPKKICDGCSYKLDMLYEFWNTTANAEKQLLSWLGEAGMNSKMTDDTISAVAQQIKPTETFVKQEAIDPSDIHTEVNDDDKSYMFQQKFTVEEAGPSATVTSNEEEPPPKRARRTAAVKAQIAMDPESDDDDDSGEPMTKMEDESEDSDGEDREPTFVDVPSTSADDQPGPSGVGKDGVEAPEKTCLKSYFSRFKLKNCHVILNDIKENTSFKIRNNHVKLPRFKYKCYICCERFQTHEDLVSHKLRYKKKACKRSKSAKVFSKLKRKRRPRKVRVHSSNIFSCKHCLKVFLSRKHYKDHLGKHNRAEKIRNLLQVPDVIVPKTLKGRKRKSHLEISAENFHDIIIPAEDSIDIQLSNPDLLNSALQYEKRAPNEIIRNFHYHCLLCSRNFLIEDEFREHIDMNICALIPKCYICKTQFENNSHLLYHVLAVHGNQHICVFCYTLFENTWELQQHKKSSHFKYFRCCCLVCCQCFSTVSEYRKHCREEH